MHTARDGRTKLAAPFRQAGTVGDDGTDSFDLPSLPRRARGPQSRPRPPGGRRLAHAVACAFPDSTAARWGIRLRGVKLHEQLQAAMHHRALRPRPLHLSVRRSRPDAPCRRRPFRCRRLCRGRGRLSAQAGAARGPARGQSSGASRRSASWTTWSNRFLPDTPTPNPPGRRPMDPFPFLPNARRSRHLRGPLSPPPPPTQRRRRSVRLSSPPASIRPKGRTAGRSQATASPSNCSAYPARASWCRTSRPRAIRATTAPGPWNLHLAASSRTARR